MSKKFITGQAVILAAGASSRFWPINGQHKCLVKIMGRPMILSLIEGLKTKGIKEVIVVQGPGREVEKEVRNYKSDLPIKYAIQPTPRGTGDAILKAEKMIKGHFFVFNSERVDTEEYIEPIINKFKKEKSEIIILAGKTSAPWLYGILKVKKDKVIGLVEKPSRGQEPSKLKIVGTYFFPKEFLNYLKRVPQSEYSLIDAILLCVKEKEVKIVDVGKETFALKYPWDMFEIRKYVFDKFLKNKISKTAEIAKSAEIKGKVFIGDNVKILEGAKIKGPCYIGDDCVVGNNALVRDYADLEKKVLVGAFAEIARSILQEGVETHSGYFGDSIIGDDCYIGADTVTANIRLDREEIKSTVKGKEINTGLKKLGAIVGKNTKIGANVSIMPGVMIGSNCQIGPHSLILKNIEDDVVFYTKAENVIKKNK